LSLKPEHELGVRANLDLTRRVLDKSFRVFVLPALVASLAYEALRYATRPFFPAYLVDPSKAAEAMSMSPAALFTSLIGFLCLLSFYSLLTVTLSNCVSTAGTAAFFMDEPLQLGPLVTSVIPRVPVIIATGVIALAASGLLSAALFIPGLLAQAVFSMLVPVVMLEGLGVAASLQRCWMLVKGRLTATLTLLICLTLFTMAASFTASLIIGYVGFTGDNALVPYTALTSMVAPVVPISWTIHYYSLLTREKNATS
jgi:hypothetical protein